MPAIFFVSNCERSQRCIDMLELLRIVDALRAAALYIDTR